MASSRGMPDSSPAKATNAAAVMDGMWQSTSGM